MKKIVVIGVAFIMFLQGCAEIPNGTKENLGAEYGPRHPMDYVSYTADQTDDNVNQGQRRVNNFGFSRRDSNEVGLDQEMNVYDIIDHQKTAEGIGSLLVQSPEVKEASVLITNEYALVAYTPSENSSNNTANMVKMTTEAAIPYYYETVITDNPRMKQDIEAFKSMDERSQGGHSAIEQLVNDMKRTTSQPETK